MAKIVRYNGNLVPFASSSLGTERTLFGSVTQANDITSQYTASFLRGWGIVGPSDQPTLQDFNAVSYTHGQILSYLHQMGVAEYNATQEYHIGSVTQVGEVIYISRQNTNIGNTPSSSPTFWRDASSDPVTVPLGATNLRASIPAASATATWTADQMVVGASLAGAKYMLPTWSQAINIGTVGAGGMDAAGSIVSTWIAVYAIYNPTTGTRSMLGVNVGNTVAPDICAGVMPSGYTASKLISVVRTTAASLFDIAFQTGNHIANQDRAAVNSGTIVGSLTNIAITGNIPGNAKTVNFKGNIASSSGNVTLSFSVAGSIAGVANTGAGATNSVAGAGFSVPLPGIPIVNPQNAAYTASVGSGSMTFILSTIGYYI